MSATDAALRLLEPVDGATVETAGKVVPAWDRILDDSFIAMCSDGERALIWAALQLYNGGGRDLHCDLHRAVVYLDDENYRRLIQALADVRGWLVALAIPVGAKGDWRHAG